MTVRSLFDAYWPAATALLVFFWVWRLAKASLRLWMGEERLEEPPERRSDDDEVRLPEGAGGSMAWAVVKWLLLACVLAAATGYGLFRLLGSPRLPSSSSFSTTELLDLLKIGLAVIGGLGAVVALAVAYRKQQVSEAAHVIATHQEQRERTKFFNERYVKAAEQLGHERFAVRLAGVYAMVSLADDWPAQRQTCVNVLCGYLRTPYPTDDPTEREVRQEIMTTLLDHVWDQGWHSQTVDLDFRGVEFENLDLSRRTFRGNFHFDNAVFHGDTADFSKCIVTGDVSFRGARFAAKRTTFSELSLRRAVLDFSQAHFTGGTVDFSVADLTNGTINLSRTTVQDTVVDFEWLMAQHGVISLDEAELRNATIDLSSVNVLPMKIRDRSRSEITFRSVVANGSTIKFNGSKLDRAGLVVDGARFLDCALEATSAEAMYVDLSAKDAESDDFVRQLRRMRNAGNREGSRRSAARVDQ
ncbi:pentapeptide repeat-containing protein [Saccharothrix sp. S26]|uniref:pentapeptide repeat-containing protein n=1 Tax=Saccharothrix sp. S26 TaxID=2907215 RepID=UPI001F2553A3|nr:pentapeptide repeat-containing protein [Saccharothrix sp. S26]MCE6995585.1 pentapeptide repeat-containing protein [Saccharothrix sp. S26]